MQRSSSYFKITELSYRDIQLFYLSSKISWPSLKAYFLSTSLNFRENLSSNPPTSFSLGKYFLLSSSLSFASQIYKMRKALFLSQEAFIITLCIFWIFFFFTTLNKFSCSLTLWLDDGDSDANIYFNTCSLPQSDCPLVKHIICGNSIP